MSTYVLEILDGDQKGVVFELDETRASLGRKPDNTIVLQDEKCSGQHAVVAFEDGRYVLRDVGSRNGTLLDGRKVTEVVLSPFDVFQVGRTQIVFRAEGEQMAVEDLSVATLDRAAMTRRGGKRKLPLGVILSFALILGGGGAWAWFQFGQKEGGRAGSRPIEPLVVAGNLLPAGAGDFEEDGTWVLNGLDAAGFEAVLGRGVAHTGEVAIEAAYRPGGDGESPQRLAIARYRESVQVTAESKLRLSGYLATDGAARVALRLAFNSTADDAELLTGTVPASYDDWTETSVTVAVPRGFDRVEVEVLALLPDADSLVRADDISLIIDRSAAVEPIQLSTSNGCTLSGAGAGFRMTTGNQVVLHGVRPLVDDPLLVDLDRRAELAPSDAGLQMTVGALDESGFTIRFTAVEGASNVRGIALDVPFRGGDVLGRAGSGLPFTPVAAGVEPVPLVDVLFGSEATRCALAFDSPTAIGVTHARGVRSISIAGLQEFTLRVRFEAEAKAARELVRNATNAQRTDDYRSALDAIQQVAEKYPHDDRLAREAQAIRVALLGELGERTADLRWEGVVAEFFDARNGYERVAAGIEQLIATYGEDHIPQIDGLRELSGRMQAGIAKLDEVAGAEHRANLVDLAAALDDAGRERLSAKIRDYVQRNYPQEGGR